MSFISETSRSQRNPRKERSTSRTFISNEVFYGDPAVDADASRYSTQTKLMMRDQAANTLTRVEGAPARYGKGQKPRDRSLNGIIGGTSHDGPSRPRSVLDDHT